MLAFVYLLCFDKPYPNGHRPCHYIGVAAELEKRILEHRAGSSKCALTRALKSAGIGFELVRWWTFETPDAAFAFERQVKRRRRHRVFCPRCTGVIKDVVAA